MLAVRAPRRILIPRPQGASKRWGSGGAPPARIVRVVDLQRESADAVTLYLAVDEGAPLSFRAGQYLTHCFEIDGQVVRRAYSLSSPEGGPLACTIKLIPGGWVSSHVHEALQVGSRYRVLGPSGNFVLHEDESDAPLRFLAGGCGITPIISLIETALSRDAQRDIHLLYASRSEADLLFRERLDGLAARHPSLKVRCILSQPSAEWRGETGRLDGEGVLRRLGVDAAARYYLCGPTGLMQAAESALRSAAIPPSQIRQERFLAAPQVVQARSRAPQPIVLQRSGRQVTQQPGESILEAALREGARLQFSCMVGGCGHCRVQVLDGQVALSEPNCLTAEERSAGYTLACSASALGPVTIAA